MASKYRTWNGKRPASNENPVNMPARNVGRKSSSRLASALKKKNCVNFILSLFTESLPPKKNFLDLNLRKMVTVFTVERQILLITPLLITCSRNHSARKCCDGSMLLTPPPFRHSVLRNCFLVW